MSGHEYHAPFAAKTRLADVVAQASSWVVRALR